MNTSNSETSVKELLSKIYTKLSSNKKVLNFQECLEYTGFSKNHLYRLTSTQAIPYSKPSGGKIFFNKEKIDEWLLSNPITPNSSINQKAINYTLRNKKA